MAGPRSEASYRLEPVSSAADWQSYHAIRRAILWDDRAREGYDDQHPDDRHPDHRPLLLKAKETALGTVRLDDRRDGSGVVRLVAVVAALQRRGLGRVMSGLIDREAERLGMRTLLVNAAPDAVGFYERMGWDRFTWDATELAGHAADCVQMRKLLAP